jgi:hypothetical protein
MSTSWFGVIANLSSSSSPLLGGFELGVTSCLILLGFVELIAAENSFGLQRHVWSQISFERTEGRLLFLSELSCRFAGFELFLL